MYIVGSFNNRNINVSLFTYFCWNGKMFRLYKKRIFPLFIWLCSKFYSVLWCFFVNTICFVKSNKKKKHMFLLYMCLDIIQFFRMNKTNVILIVIYFSQSLKLNFESGKTATWCTSCFTEGWLLGMNTE